MRRLFAIALAAVLPCIALCAYANVPYALNLLDEYPEFGSNPPPDICEGEVRSPCVVRATVLYAPVTNIETVRNKLSPEAWSALRRAAPGAQEVWLFNVCMDKLPQYPNCFAVFGVATLSKQRATVYAFFKPKVYPD